MLRLLEGDDSPVTGDPPASPSGAVNVPKSGDRDYREAPPGCQGKNTRSCGVPTADTIILLLNELWQLAGDGSSIATSDSHVLHQRIQSDTNAVFIFEYQ